MHSSFLLSSVLASSSSLSRRKRRLLARVSSTSANFADNLRFVVFIVFVTIGVIKVFFIILLAFLFIIVLLFVAFPRFFLFFLFSPSWETTLAEPDISSNKIAADSCSSGEVFSSLLRRSFLPRERHQVSSFVCVLRADRSVLCLHIIVVDVILWRFVHVSFSF